MSSFAVDRAPVARTKNHTPFVGMFCNCSLDVDPKKTLSASQINRAFLIDALLASSGTRIFLCSPKDIMAGGEVVGYRVDGHEFVRATQPVPRVNANWTYGTRRLINKGIGYRRFKRWVRTNQVGVYAPYDFAELVSNKLKAYEVIREHDESLHLLTEDFVGSAAQVEAFLACSTVAFIKPRAGNKGNGIFVMRKSGQEYSLTHYNKGQKRLFSSITLSAAMGIVSALGDKKYIIQQGLEALRYEGAIFDVRVVMVHNGHRWHAILESRLAPRGSDLTNIYQGGSIQITEELLASLFGDDLGRVMEEKVRRVSHGVAEYLDSFFPSEVMEMGLDFVFDEQRNLHLVEVNAKPGVAGIGSEIRLFNWKDEDAPLLERWVHPQMKHLAGFLLSKIQQTRSSEREELGFNRGRLV